MKLYLILAVFIIFYFFFNDFGLVDIQKTAVILAVGIDKTDNGYSVTTEIAVPKGSDRKMGGTSSLEIVGEGKNVSACISDIFSKTSWVPKFVFCDLIVIGERAAKEDVFSYLNYFIRNKYMPESCNLAVCEGAAQEIISSQSAIDDTSSLAIGKLFSDASVKSGMVMPNTLKDFTIGYFGPSKSSYLPYLRSTPQKGSHTHGGSGGSNSSSGGSGGNQVEEQAYSAEETALFSEGRMVGLLPHELTFAFSLLKGNVHAGNFNAKEDDADATLTILEDEGGVELDMKKQKVTLSLDLHARLCCKSVTSEVEEIASEEASDEALESAEKLLRADIEKLWNTCKEADCDLFNLRRSLYRSSHKKYEEWKDDLIDSLEVEIKTNVNR